MSFGHTTTTRLSCFLCYAHVVIVNYNRCQLNCCHYVCHRGWLVEQSQSFCLWWFCPSLFCMYRHARARAVLRLVTLECQTFYFLDLCCYCNTRDVTCVCHLFESTSLREKKRGESNSISRMNRRWCVPLTAGACLIAMFYVQCPVGQFTAPPCSSWLN